MLYTKRSLTANTRTHLHPIVLVYFIFRRVMKSIIKRNGKTSISSENVFVLFTTKYTYLIHEHGSMVIFIFTECNM